MTKLFAASAYVAVMSLAIVGEAGSRGAPAPSGVLSKGDCGGRGCGRSAERSGETSIASLTRTGPNETTAARSAAR